MPLNSLESTLRGIQTARRSGVFDELGYGWLFILLMMAGVVFYLFDVLQQERKRRRILALDDRARMLKETRICPCCHGGGRVSREAVLSVQFMGEGLPANNDKDAAAKQERTQTIPPMPERQVRG